MTLLARLQTLALAKETTAGTYVAPLRSIPITSVKPEDVITPLRDESIRGNDVVLQTIYGGSIHSTFDYTIPHLYVDTIGDHLRAIIGPDTMTAGVSTTLSAATAAGATSITTAATIPAGSTIRIDTGTKIEYAVTGTPTGSGPYTIPLLAAVGGASLALLQAHSSAVAVLSQTLHSFAQDQRATPLPTYSLTQFNKIETRGFPGCTMSDFDMKIDPKGAASADVKWTGFQSAPQTFVASNYTTAQPIIGWQWALTLGGVASTRATSGEFSLKRAIEIIDSSDGTQGPREIFGGALECDYKMKAIFENDLDYNQFTGYQVLPVVNTFTQPLSFGGSLLTMTSSSQKYTKFAPDFSGVYLMADIEASGAMNATDGGVVAVTLSNFVTTQY